MMKHHKLTHLILILIFTVFACDFARAQNHQETPFGVSDDWFFYVSTGIGRPSYGNDLQNRIDLQKARGGVSHTAGFFDLPAIYRKTNESWLLGIALNASFEHVAESWRIKDSYAIHSYNPALSSFWFPSQRIGDRWFLRSDLGYSRILEIRESLAAGSNALVYDRDVTDALFAQAGLGYGWSASQVARLLVHANAFGTFAGKHRISGINFYMGFMF